MGKKILKLLCSLSYSWIEFCYRNIHVWDLRKNYTVYKGDPLPKTTINYGGLACRSGIASLSLNPGKTLLYAAAMDDVIYEFNVASYDGTPGIK